MVGLNRKENEMKNHTQEELLEVIAKIHNKTSLALQGMFDKDYALSRIYDLTSGVMRDYDPYYTVSNEEAAAKAEAKGD